MRFAARIAHGHPVIEIGLGLLVEPCGEIGFIWEEIDNHLSVGLDAIQEGLRIRLHTGLQLEELPPHDWPEPNRHVWPSIGIEADRRHEVHYTPASGGGG